MEYGIHWFRRDLRVAGNMALQQQFQKFDGRVVGMFCFDKKFLSRPDFSHNRFQLFLNSLLELQKEMREIGSELLFFDVGPEDAFKKIISSFKEENIEIPKMISWNRDYEPFARKRDEKIEKFLKNASIEVLTCRDHLLIEPSELKKEDGGVYKVYTPFSRKWLELFDSDEVQMRVELQKKGLTYLRKRLKGETSKIFNLTWKKLLKDKIKFNDYLQEYIDHNKKHVNIEIPPAGSLAAFTQIQKFKDKIENYNNKRDYPSILGTSKISMFLKNGSITIPQIIALFDLKSYKKKNSGRDTFLSELIWREFYYHILYHFPEVETSAFQEKYNDLAWENDKKLFKAWCAGKTGFPIVDAGMRELNQTGWMHNRVRMIVASFLTKDLLIDWKWGEKYFMEKLLDGDLAPNNGGWQWAASTGCDAQPYFRIFNPWLQSKRFDSEGDYIKTFIPELNELKAKELHEPILDHPTYPKPIVEHSEQREKALKLFKIEE